MREYKHFSINSWISFLVFDFNPDFIFILKWSLFFSCAFLIASYNDFSMIPFLILTSNSLLNRLMVNCFLDFSFSFWNCISIWIQSFNSQFNMSVYIISEAKDFSVSTSNYLEFLKNLKELIIDCIHNSTKVQLFRCAS